MQIHKAYKKNSEKNESDVHCYFSNFSRSIRRTFIYCQQFSLLISCISAIQENEKLYGWKVFIILEYYSQNYCVCFFFLTTHSWRKLDIPPAIIFHFSFNVPICTTFRSCCHMHTFNQLTSSKLRFFRFVQDLYNTKSVWQHCCVYQVTVDQMQRSKTLQASA